ncbi:hypothetical protein Sjap_014212 [Stephania japonica]|uniref:Uncharacterized protein n=1 Tax=Stephania japonica TaxID=461633 RepID=A0AAP0J070_9MAGN
MNSKLYRISKSLLILTPFITLQTVFYGLYVAMCIFFVLLFRYMMEFVDDIFIYVGIYILKVLAMTNL